MLVEAVSRLTSRCVEEMCIAWFIDLSRILSYYTGFVYLQMLSS